MLKLSERKKRKEILGRLKEGMWTVPKETLKVTLPSGFFLKESEDLVSLFFKDRDKAIDTFNSKSVNPEEIRKSALEYLKKRS